MKKLVSLLLVLVMIFSLLPMSALAAEENVQTETEQSLETEGSVGTLLGNTLDGAGAMDEDTSSCSVTDISVDGKTATVEYQTDRAAELVVAIYEESTNRMLGSGHAVVSPDADTATVEITIDSMPSYYVVSAYLLDADGLEPLCDAFTSSYYTQDVTELRSKTAADFDEDRVLLLEEGNTDTNFLVFSEGTLMAKEGETANQITDNGDGTYTITNADERYQTLSAGDSFAYTYADGTVLVVVAASVKVDGTTVTVTANTEAELEDVFDYVKIEATSDGADAIVDTSTMGKNATYLGVEDNSSTAKGRAVNENAEWGTSHKIELNFFEKEDDDADIKIEINTTVEFSVKLELKVYLAKKYQFIEFSTKLKTSISGEIVGKITAWEHPLGEYKLPLISGIVYLSFKPKVVLTFEASLTFEMSQSSTIGFVYDSNYGFQSKSEDPEPDQEPEKSLEFEGKVYFGLKVELGLVLVDEDVLGFYVSGEVGFELSMKQDVLEESDSEVHDCDICFEGDISVVGKIGVELKALFDKFNPSTTLLSVKGKLTDIYYSESFGEFGFSVCPHKSYLVTVDCTVIDMNSGEYLDDVSGWKVVVADLESTEPVEQLVLETNKDGKASFYAPNGTYSVVVSPPAGLHMSAKGTMVTVHNTATKTPFFFLLPSEGEDGDEDDKTDENTTEPTESDGEVLYSGTCGVGVQWELYESGLLYIYGNGAMANYTSASSVPWHSYRASITRVIVAEGVTSIGRASFYGCTALASVTLPDSLTSIGRDACYGCTSLSSITLPDNLVSIGQGAFRNCTSLSVITIPDNVTSIGSEAFYKCTSLECIVIPDKVASVGSETFYGCTSLSCITLPDNLTSIGGGAFRNCTSLSNVLLPNVLTSIGSYTFYGCTTLANITIPDSVTSIGNYAFYNCKSLTSIMIPEGVTSIKSYVFYGCTSLADIKIPDDATNIGECAFSGCTSLANITIPDSVVSIGGNAFSACASLASIVLPEGVTRIEWSTFRGCTSLVDITIPDGVTLIGGYAFSGCTSLVDITIPDGVTSIGESMFNGCSALTSVSIPDGITGITHSAFKRCTSLTSITIPSSVTSVDDYAFWQCFDLVDVYYGGSEEQWEDVTIETHNAPLTSATIHYNYVPTSTVTLDEPVGAVEEATPEEITEEVTEETTEEITEEVTMEETTTEEVTEETTKEITEETVTEETTEETTTEETTTEEKTTYEADEIELLAAYTGVIDGSTAGFTDLVPNERYVLLVMKDSEAADPLAADNLLYIVQGVSSETGTLSFVYVPREEVEGAAVVYGAGGIDVSHATVTIGVAVGGAVVVEVELDGEVLVEKTDYTFTSETGDDGMISVTVTGCDGYFGTTTRKLDHTPGDMNGQDGVNILDVLALLKAVAGITDKPDHADVNGDGEMTILDVLTLLKYVAGIKGTTIY